MPIRVAETKTLVVHLLNYEALKISYKKELWQLSVFCFTLFMLISSVTITKYSFSAKKVISSYV